jgi:hypothetical protein
MVDPQVICFLATAARTPGRLHAILAIAAGFAERSLFKLEIARLPDEPSAGFSAKSPLCRAEQFRQWFISPPYPRARPAALPGFSGTHVNPIDAQF